MPPFTIRNCTIANSKDLARNNMTAFWLLDATWILVWKGKTLEHVIKQAALRMPHNLLTDRPHRRHQMTTDDNTGQIAGYIRWILPSGMGVGTSEQEMMNVWTEAIVPDISEEQKNKAKEAFQSADWMQGPPPGELNVDELDVPVIAMKNELMAKKNYINLDYLAVHPDYGRQGIATKLVENGVQEAEKLGLPIFVLAMKAGYGVYKRLGFKLLDQIIQDDTKYGGKGEYAVYFLEKEPGKENAIV